MKGEALSKQQSVRHLSAFAAVVSHKMFRFVSLLLLALVAAWPTDIKPTTESVSGFEVYLVVLPSE